MDTMEAASAVNVVCGLDESESACTLMELVVEADRGVRAAVARRYRALSRLAGHRLYAGDPVRAAAMEVACVLRVSEHTAGNDIARARTLTGLFPEALGALEAGMVQEAQVRALISATAVLSEDAARAAQDRVLPMMPEQNPAATRRALARAVIKIDPAAAEARREREIKARRVAHHPRRDGMGTLTAKLPAEQAVHAMNAIDAHARASRNENPGDDRTLDRARADAFYALVTGIRSPAACPAALVQVTVPLDTLLGIDEEPGELDGYGPITALAARAMAANADSMWWRLLTAPDTGEVVKAGPNRYHPTTEVRRHVSARDGHCTFPTCSMPAAKTDLDHVVPLNHRQPDQGGQTIPDNLQPLCRYHQRLKAHAGWSVQRSETHPATTTDNTATANGTATATGTAAGAGTTIAITVWTAPSGQQYTGAAASAT